MTTPASPTPPTTPNPKDPRRFQQAQKLLLLAADILSQVQGKKIMDARRRLAAQLAVVGLTITLATLAADFFGLLRGMENFFYDQRAYLFQYNLRKPSESIVHLDIDEGALQTMGRWPWSRRLQAKVIDEISFAGPRVIFLDIVYSESSQNYVDGYPVDDLETDQIFADAIRRSGVVLAPMSVGLKGEAGFTELHRQIVTTLMERTAVPSSTQPSTGNADGAPGVASTQPDRFLSSGLNMDDKTVARRLGQMNGKEPTDVFSQAFLQARERAIELSVLAVLQANPDATLADVRRSLLGDDSRRISALNDLIRIQYRLLLQRRTIDRFGRDIPKGLPELLQPNQIQAPVVPIGLAAAYSGFVDYVESQDGDSKVRFVPLFININGRMLPHVSFAMFCAFRGVKLDDVRFEPDRVIVPGVGGTNDVVIPVRVLNRPGKTDAPLVAYIPWFGGRAWETMYDVPQHIDRRQRVSLTAVQNVFDTEDRILTNINASRALALTILEPFDAPMAEEFKKEKYGVDNAMDYVKRLADITTFLSAFIEGLEQVPPADRRPEDEALLANFNTLRRTTKDYTRQFELLVEQFKNFRADLRRQLGGKIILVGMTGTGTMDYYPNPIHSNAPGVVAHGALVNGLLTGELWSRAPIWVTYLLTFVVGVVTTLIVAFVSPWKASVGAISAIAIYTFFNGFVLFDTYDIIVGVAGPMTAIGATWAGVTLLRFIFEIRERNRITARFRSYVDPELVNYVAENPDQASFTGRKQIMTVVFTDLEGFTTLSEKLGEGIVGTLNDYVGAMTPIIRGNRGFIDKFLGDGIMFEFNAVIPNNHHAIDAVTAVLQMQDAMGPFNKNLDERNLPTLKMRVGVNTGPMIFGDAGGAGANNITVLGDAVNLAARLEGANKPFGSAIMVTQETLDQCEGKFTVRPIANIRVKGKENAVVVYEPLCFAGQETPEQIKLIELTTKVFKLYSAAKFEECMTACDEMNAALGGHVKFADTYHKACIHLLAEGAGPDFDGSISLSEK